MHTNKGEIQVGRIRLAHGAVHHAPLFGTYLQESNCRAIVLEKSSSNFVEVACFGLLLGGSRCLLLLLLLEGVSLGTPSNCLARSWVMSGLMRHNSHTQLSELPGKTLKCVPILLVLLQLAATGQAANAGEWYVAPDGSRTSKGTKESPWDLGSALGGKQKIAPGDTIWLLAGTYARPFENLGKGYPIRLAGQKESPIHVRSVAGNTSPSMAASRS